ncbi:MAG TPA: ACT domain-containing protein, partial [Thermoanaerobaculia bacterium]|nr:ACT domain-containing protein [Thermoanaerobaculia bacterium]
FDAVGILAAVAGPLAEARVSILAIATFDTDYVLVKETDVPRVRATLEARGITVADR